MYLIIIIKLLFNKAKYIFFYRIFLLKVIFFITNLKKSFKKCPQKYDNSFQAVKIF